MEKFREFQGRDLDECIREACAYFDAPREKLEVEIVQDAKSGIFGIVLARKAIIRARRVSLDEAVNRVMHPRGDAPRRKEPGKPHSRQSAPRPEQPADVEEAADVAEATEDSREAPPLADEMDRDAPEGFAARPLEELDPEELGRVASETVARLVGPVAGHDVPVTVDIVPGCVAVKVAWEGDAGLLIGREGQTLSAIQYLASRMVSHAFNCAIRVQVDIADYRSKQDDKLRELALSLARKAIETGRPCSTRPLSSYHRRLVHLALHENDRIVTRSSGEGAMKRVVIAPRRPGA